MGVVAGLVLGAGLCLLLWAVTAEPPATPLRGARWSDRLTDLLTQAGVTGVSAGGLVGASALLGALVLVTVTAVVGVPAVGLCFGLLAGGAPLALVRSRARRRRAALREVWPEVVDHLASGIRAGLSLPEALAQLGHRGPEDLRPAFLAFAEDHRVSGRFGECLDTLKARLADPVADRIVEALRLTRDVGGSDLGRLLRTLAHFLREDLRTRGELEARQSWTVNAARLAAAAPWLVLALLASRPQAAAAYDTPTGAAVLLAGGASTLVAYQLMLRVARLPEDVRVLR
ncbi:type II secretion system protein F [Actinotalea ferrariae CF5-4]|uniref:Type II secretion system protein F n=1 Tax=Actinotalea ferrariae CF5-4 TaxID=948458 RepID=A0A021VNL9_9CELL|nr:type II secretion system F family protein [Actinotalea ferrariae]EYR62746.1 type II secretion system protein F [Actinotalea ferrariae CF5-4]